MLYGNVTEGAVVYGRIVQATTYADLEAIQAKAKAMGATLFVAGDTSPTGSEEGLKHSTAIVGLPVAKAVAGTIRKFSLDEVRRAAAQYGALDWTSLGAAPSSTGNPGGASEVGEGTFLLCWGPLPQVVLAVGTMKLVDEDDEDYDEELDGGDPVYELYESTDMGQQPGLEAVDGKKIAWTEFSGCRHVDLSEEAIARYHAMVPLHQKPGLHLIVRYD